MHKATISCTYLNTCSPPPVFYLHLVAAVVQIAKTFLWNNNLKDECVSERQVRVSAYLKGNYRLVRT